jgi:2-desacetyl-2-hydroxyethyl bacteriochlorophyllide A dehydrogenase
MHARTILFTGVGQVALAETTIPDPGPGEVLVEAAYTCVSPGTELRCLAGQQDGGDVWPFIPGYALTGVVVARGPGATLAEGTRVFCAGTERAGHRRLWGGHVSHAVLPERVAYVLPPEVDLLDGSLANLAAVAYHGARVARTAPGEEVAVVGLGSIGQLAARCHAIVGGRVVAADRSPQRVELARRAGVEAVVASGSLAEAFAPYQPQGADVVVDATGLPAVLPGALALVRPLPWGDGPLGSARYVVQGSYPADFAVPYQAAFVKELSFLIPRGAHPADLRAVIGLMAEGRLPVGDLVAIRSVEQAPEVYATLRDSPGELLTVAFAWG